MADDDGFVTLGLQIENTAANQLAKIGSDAEKAAKKTFGNTEKTIQQTVDKSYERTQKLYAEWGRVGESFSKLSGKEIEAPKINTQHFEVAENALDLMEQKLGNIGAQIGAVTEKLSQTESEYAKIGAEKGFDSSEALKLENTLTSLQSKLIGLQSTALSTEEKLARAAQKSSEKAQTAHKKAYDNVVSRAQRAAQQTEQYELKAEKARSKSASRAVKNAENSYNQQLQACKRYVNKYADAQADANSRAAANTAKAQQKMQRSTEKGTGTMSTAFQKFGKTMAGSLKAVFVTAVLYKFFSAFKENIAGAISKNKEFAKSMNAVKANLSVAFTPIIEAIMPMLTRLAQGIATVTKYIATFIAAIFGKTYKQAVESTKKLQSQADKAKASSSRDFDELHTVEKNDDSSESDKANFDALDTSQLNTGPMQKLQELLDKVKGTVEKLTPAAKKLYEKVLKPIGVWIGGKLKDGLQFIIDLIGKVGDWVSSHTESFEKLGDSLGRLWEFCEPILNAAWDGVKNAISGMFDGLLDTLGSILDVAPDIIDFVVALFSGDWSELEEIGANILDGLWEGIKKYWEYLKTEFSTIWNGIIDFVKAIFGIHSPSTVFADIGKNIIQGCIDGIKATWENLKNFVSEKFTSVKDTAIGVFDKFKTGLKEKCNGIWTNLKEFINKMLGGIENMLNKPINALNSFIRKLNSLKIDIPDILGGGTIGFNIGEFSQVSIPRLARGGIVDKPTLSLIGEAGSEAVVPLQNNTEWMGKLSAELASAIAAVIMPLFMQQKTPQDNGGEKNLYFNIDGQNFIKIIFDLMRKYPPDITTQEG